MIYVIIYIIIVFIHGYIKYWKETNKKIDIESVAFSYWIHSLNKTGFPKKSNNTSFNYVELYHYWKENVDKTPWYEHTKRQFKETNNG